MATVETTPQYDEPVFQAYVAGAEKDSGLVGLWISHARTHPGFANRRSEALWQALHHAQSAVQSIEHAYRESKAAERWASTCTTCGRPASDGYVNEAAGERCVDAVHERPYFVNA